MREDAVLGGFSAVFEQINRPSHSEPGVVDMDNDLQEYKNDFDFNYKGDDDDNQDNPSDDNNTPGEDDVNDYPGANDDDKKDVENDVLDDSHSDHAYDDSSVVISLFDAISEKAGWGDVSDDEKPKSLEDLVSYMTSVVEKNSVPEYANSSIAELDEFVRNGGRIDDYLALSDGKYDIDYIDSDDIAMQKSILREFLSEKGFSEDAIIRKINKYEDADILEDEANDALEFLKESQKSRKEALLEEQKILKEEAKKEQQRFYNDVVSNIEAMNDVRGIKIPREDKRLLMEYIFKVESDGTTKYQKDYSKSVKNLIESAYFTMKGDALIDSAKRSGGTSAVEKLRKSLNSNKITSKQTTDNGSTEPLWSMVSRQLRRP